MVWLENVGTISSINDEDAGLLWTVPNCFAFFDPFKESSNIISCVVSSPRFNFNCCYGDFCLALIANKNCSYHDSLGLFIWKTSSGYAEPGFTVELGLMSADSKERKFDGPLNSYGCFGKWGFLPLKKLNASSSDVAGMISTDGLLRFFCNRRSDLQISRTVPVISKKDKKKDDTIVSEEVVVKVPKIEGVDLLVENLKRLLIEEENCDAVLKVEDREFKAHRTILMARSPVFASMFKHDTKESATGEVDIPDCSSATFEVFLLYLYTGSVDKMSSNNVCELYYTGDKYQMDDLKSKCVEYMKENLSVENFCPIMTLSLQHSESDLLKKATNFFCVNLKDIIRTVQWQEYLKNCPTEANELFIKATNDWR